MMDKDKHFPVAGDEFVERNTGNIFVVRKVMATTIYALSINRKVSIILSFNDFYSRFEYHNPSEGIRTGALMR